MRFFLFTLALFLCGLVLLGAPQAKAEICTPTPGGAKCLGSGCTTPGMTTMDSNRVNLIACLETSEIDSTPVWKSMSGGSAPSCISMYMHGGYPTITCPAGYTATGGGGSCDDGSTYLQFSHPVPVTLPGEPTADLAGIGIPAGVVAHPGPITGWKMGCASGGYPGTGNVFVVCCK